MLGAIIGDIVGSIYEFDNIKTKDFEFFQPEMERTDDSILCIATADWLARRGGEPLLWSLCPGVPLSDGRLRWYV